VKTDLLDVFFTKRRTSLIEKLAKSNSPEKLLLYSFLFIIFLGSVLLTLPFANIRTPAAYVDNLFVSVSAVCVTGLTTVTVAEQYSLFGKIILIFLMEIGGLGPMTIIAIIMQRNKRRMATVEKKLFAATSGKSNLYDVPSYLRKIFLYTVVLELIGFILFSLRLCEHFGFEEGLFNSLFLSVSAFTNAGFDCFAADSLVQFAADPLICLTVMALIITGGLGFIVWFELHDLIRFRFRQRRGLHKKHRYLTEHAYVVLNTTAVLLVSGAVLFAILESGKTGTINQMDGPERVLVSMFQSVTLRTAGFSTVNIGSCTRPMLLIMCVYMLIGGSPGGTAGGIKTTTAAVLFKTAFNSLNQKHRDALIRYRKISSSIMKQAFMIVTLYFAIIFAMTLVLTVSEPSVTLLSLLFEVFSAIGTVGISTGITPVLSITGKIVIMLLMFIGRMGPLSLYTAFHKEQKFRNHVEYPDANLIIG